MYGIDNMTIDFISFSENSININIETVAEEMETEVEGDNDSFSMM